MIIRLPEKDRLRLLGCVPLLAYEVVQGARQALPFFVQGVFLANL